MTKFLDEIKNNKKIGDILDTYFSNVTSCQLIEQTNYSIEKILGKKYIAIEFNSYENFKYYKTKKQLRKIVVGEIR